MCVPDNSGIDSTYIYGHSSAAANGSWDWNCDGTVTVAIDFGCAVNSCPDPTKLQYSSNPNGDCSGSQASVENAACGANTTQLACFTQYWRSCGFALYGGFDGDQASQCNKPFDYWSCEWSGGKCIAQPGSYMQYTSTCD
jgi:hypothetical protein